MQKNITTTWVKLFIIFLFTTLFTIHAYGVDIVLENKITKVAGDNIDDNTTCKAGDVYRLSNIKSDSVIGEFDLLLHVVAEDNEGDEIDFEKTKLWDYAIPACISLSPKFDPEVGPTIDIALRDRDNNEGNTSAYMDIEFIPIRKGTPQGAIDINSAQFKFDYKLKINNLNFTAFDLDLSPKTSDTDNIYIAYPGTAKPGLGSKVITIVDGNESYNNGKYTKLVGREQNCNDTVDHPEVECRAFANIKGERSSGDRILVRLQNDDAFGSWKDDFVPPPFPKPTIFNHYDVIYRLFQISLNSGFLPNTDHGDAPESYGDAYHEINSTLILGTEEADDEERSYSDNADADDRIYTDANGEAHTDDEGAVSSAVGNTITMTAGYPYDVNITIKGDGYLSVWADSNKIDINSSFDENADRILTDQIVSSDGTQPTIVALKLPQTAKTGESFIRFRLSDSVGTHAIGFGGKGEVEDYKLVINPAGIIHGVAYNDKNGNGQQDAGELGFPNIHITVTAANGEIQTVTTNAQGEYTFEGVATGTASVNVLESDLETGAAKTVGTTNPTTTDVVAGETHDLTHGYQFQANLVTTKTVDKSNPDVGDTVIYTISVTNNGPAKATNVTLTDKLPTGVRYVSHLANGTYNPSNGLWDDIAEIDNGQTETLQIKARVEAGAGSTVTNITTPATTPDQNDTTPDDDDLNETIDVQGNADINVSNVTVHEADGNMTFVISLSKSSHTNTIINVKTQQGSAHAGVDYITVNKNITIPAEQTEVNVTVEIVDNNTFEPTETFTLKATVVGDTTRTAVGTGTILDDDTPGLKANDDETNGTVGSPVEIDVLANDTSETDIDPKSVQLIDPNNPGTPVTTLTVPGEGTWTVDPDTGKIKFTPVAGFIGDPTPVGYTFKDTAGNGPSNVGTVTVNYAIGTVAGAVYEDTNDNGTQDPNEPGLQGVKVEITDASGNKHILTTDANGQYAMEVPEGNTSINIDEDTLPEGSTQTEGTNPTPKVVPEDGIAKDIDGYKPAENAGKIDGIVYEDTNDNGTQDANESGIEGVKVSIAQNGNTRIVTTDKEGKYSVTVAPNSAVTVDIDDSTVPGGSTHKEGEDPITVTVGDNETVTVVDGYKPADDRGTIKGVIYNDLNGDGVRNANEPGLEGVTVEITDSEGNTQTVQTDENGTYTVLAPTGDATITINEDTLPGGSKQTGGTNPSTVTVVKDETATDSDGYQLQIPHGTIEGVVYYDEDAKGSQDPSEKGIPNVHVSVIDNKGSIQTLITDKDGKYSTVISIGDALVDIAQEDLNISYVQTEGDDPTPLTVPENGTVRDVDGFSATDAPVAVDDKKDNVIIGTPATIDVIGNDRDKQNDIDPTTVSLDPESIPNGKGHGIDTDGDGDIDKVVVDDEGTWTVDPTTGEITFTPEAGFEKDPTPIEYTVKDDKNNESNPASVTVDYYQPVLAKDDSAIGEVGKPVVIDILGNDKDGINALDPKTVKIEGATSPDGKTKIVENEGIWTVDPVTGKITFTPEAGFKGNPTPIEYTVKDNQGTPSEPAKVTITVNGDLVAKDDRGTGENVGDPVTVHVLNNDSHVADLKLETVKIVGAKGDGRTLVVPNEGTWTVDPKTGDIKFTPLPSFKGNPTPIKYTVKDTLGNTSNAAKVTVTYGNEAPEVADDKGTGKVGDTVAIDILKNDTDLEGDINASTVSLMEPYGLVGVTTKTDADGNVKEIKVPNEGTWKVDDNGKVTFIPLPGFTGDPTPISYTVKDNYGNESNEADIAIDVDQKLSNDRESGYYGVPVTVEVLANDDLVLPHTINLIPPKGIKDFKLEKDDNGYVKKIIVPNEGTWTIDEKGLLTFTPEMLNGKPVLGIANPTPISYTAKDSTGNTIKAATVTITYSQRPIIVVPGPVQTQFVQVPAPNNNSLIGDESLCPSAVDDNFTTTDAASYTFDVSSNDANINDNNDTFNVIDPKTSKVMPVGAIVPLTHGTVTMQKNGKFVYRPYPDTLTKDIYLDETFRYQVTRKGGSVVCGPQQAKVYICGECFETSDADALSTMSMFMLMFMTGMFGLYFISKEENES